MVINNGQQFTAFVRRCLEQPDYAAALGNRARSLVLSQLGATERTQRLLSSWLTLAVATARLMVLLPVRPSPMITRSVMRIRTACKPLVPGSVRPAGRGNCLSRRRGDQQRKGPANEVVG